MDYDKKTIIKQYGLKLKNYGNPQTEDERDRDLIIRQMSLHSKVLERNEFAKYEGRIMERARAKGDSMDQHLKEPFKSVLEVIYARAKEIDDDLDGERMIGLRSS